MDTAEYYPYRTAAARDVCYRYLDGLAAKVWPASSLAAQYALHSPGRLDKVILLAPGATVLRPPAEFWVRLIALGITRGRGLRAFFRWIFADMARTDPHWIDATIEMLSLNMRSIQRHNQPMPSVLTDTEWGNLRVPTLFLAGENEVIYSAERAVRRLKRVAPQVTAQIIPGAGHDLTVAQTPIVNEAILQFLRQERAPAKALGACAG